MRNFVLFRKSILGEVLVLEMFFTFNEVEKFEVWDKLFFRFRFLERVELKLDLVEECFILVRRSFFFLGGSFFVGNFDKVLLRWG